MARYFLRPKSRLISTEGLAKYNRTIVVFLCFSMLSSCAWFKDSASKGLPGDSETEVHFVPQLKLKKVWSLSAGGISNTHTKYMPLRQGNAVFVFDEQGTVSAISMRSGKRIWKRAFNVPVSFGIGGGNVLTLGTESGKVIAFSPKQGEILWEKQLGGGSITAISRVQQGSVLVRSAAGSITALSASDGKSRWHIKYKLPSLSLQGMSVPLIFQEFGLIGLDDGRLLIVSLKNGSVLRELRVGLLPKGSDLERIVDIDGQMVIRDGILYVANYRGRTLAIDLVNDRVLWNTKISSYSGLDVDDEQVYIAETDGGIVAVNRYTGSNVWRNPQLAAYELGTPSVFGDYVLVGDNTEFLYWLSAKDGSILARFDVDGKPDGIAQNWGKHAFVFNRDGDIFSLKVTAHAVAG